MLEPLSDSPRSLRVPPQASWRLFHPIERYFRTTRELALSLEWTIKEAGHWLKTGECEEHWLERMERYLAIFSEIDLLSGNALHTGFWTLHPHYLLNDWGSCDCSSGRVVRPCHLLAKHPSRGVEQQILHVAEDDFRNGSQQHHTLLEQLGNIIYEDGKIYDGAGKEFPPGRYPYFVDNDKGDGAPLSQQWHS
jgi:hypothetical protein